MTTRNRQKSNAKKILSTFGKLFTKIINERLNLWAEKYHVYIEAQAVFRKNMRTVDNIVILHGVITHLLNNKKLYAAFVDYTKAFYYLVRDNALSIIFHALFICSIL